MLTATGTAVEVAKPVGALDMTVERETLVDVPVGMSVLVREPKRELLVWM